MFSRNLLCTLQVRSSQHIRKKILLFLRNACKFSNKGAISKSQTEYQLKPHHEIQGKDLRFNSYNRRKHTKTQQIIQSGRHYFYFLRFIKFGMGDFSLCTSCQIHCYISSAHKQKQFTDSQSRKCVSQYCYMCRGLRQVMLWFLSQRQIENGSCLPSTCAPH